MRSDKELAHRYDLYVVPYWQDSFDQMVLKHVPIPSQGNILEVNCGTGGLALELAPSLGARGTVIATDPHPEQLKLAQAKSDLKKLANLIFLQKNPEDLGMEDEAFGLVVGDAALMPISFVERMLVEMVRLAEVEATVALGILTRGSFAEVFSWLWEALHLCRLDESAVEVEALISEYPTATHARRMMEHQGLSHVRCFTERRELDFESAQEMFESPVVEDYFLDHWLDFLPDLPARDRVLNQMAEIIERERVGQYFEISVKASLLIGRKQD